LRQARQASQNLAMPASMGRSIANGIEVATLPIRNNGPSWGWMIDP
jgi:hypothetical protein